MGIEDEIKSVLDKFDYDEPKAPPLAKGIMATIILEEFSEMRRAIHTNNDKTLTSYLSSSHKSYSYPIISEIITEYQSGAISKIEASKRMKKARNDAENYLHNRGFDLEVERMYSRRRVIGEVEMDKRMAKYGEPSQVLERADALLKKYEKR